MDVIKFENDEAFSECETTKTEDFLMHNVEVKIKQEIIAAEDFTNIDIIYQSSLSTDAHFNSVKVETSVGMTKDGVDGRPTNADVNHEDMGSEEDQPPSDDDDRSAPLPRSAYLQQQEDTQQDALVAGWINESSGNDNDETEAPKGLFEFQWTSYPQHPISPLLRREVFVGDAGPTIVDGPILNPYEIFVKIWDRAIMERIAVETNRYAQQYAKRLLEGGGIGPRSRISGWKDTDVNELYTYFALVIAIGILVKTKLEDYWSRSENIFVTPGFPAQMTLRRFQLLSRCLHFVDNQCTIDCGAQTRAEAKLSKVRPLINHLNVKFQKLYRLGQEIALDESLTQWKDSSSIKQYRPRKGAVVGIKTYEVCDSHTGYLWRFEVHAGSEIDSSEQTVIPGHIPNLVLRLLRGLENRGHTVWMGDYYNSPAIARVLKTRGFDCVGTLRTNRQFVPQEIAALKNAGMEVGWVCGATAGDVDIIVWRDRNPVAMISTYHGLAMSEGKPTVIHDYDICMGGIDKKDQQLSTYPMERKRTRVWYKKFFRHLLNVSILNAYIIYKSYQTSTHRDFRVKLVTSILENCGHEREVTMSITQGKFSPDMVAHFPRQLQFVAGSGRPCRLRRLCVVCKSKRTPIICKACNVSLCYDFEELSCFVKYHS